MTWKDVIKVALGSLGVNKLRSGLTMFGITIGVFSIVGVMTVITALRGSIETGLSFLGSNIFQFAKYPINGGGPEGRRKYDLRRNITLDQALQFKRLMESHAETVCLKVFDRNGAGQAVYNGRKTAPGLTFGGSKEHFLAAHQYTIELGRNFTPDDIELGRPVILIGQDILKKLFPSESPLGKAIKMNGRTYVVIGVFASKGQSFGGNQDDIGIIPVTRFISDFGAEGRSVNIATQALDQAHYNQTLDQAVTLMRVVRGLRPEEENDFEIYSNDTIIGIFAKVADVIAGGSFIISGIALLAAGVGIMNIMLVSVTERTKEIGIRKSIGARKKNILTQFLIEAVVISMMGGLAGILMGVVVGNMLAAQMDATMIFPWTWAITGLVVCCGIGITFGFYPAWKAASLDPIEALRYE